MRFATPHGEIRAKKYAQSVREAIVAGFEVESIIEKNPGIWGKNGENGDNLSST